jgi:hypothetical protein
MSGADRRRRRRSAGARAALALALLAAATHGRAATAIKQDEAADRGVEAYVFGYPLVLMDVTRQVMTAVPKAAGRRAPANRFVHVRGFPDDTFTDVVSPNVDTLYSVAWLDLAAAPMVLSVPDLGKRYYVMQLLDAWTNVFASPGTRTTGNGAGAFAIVGPRWTGTLPQGLARLDAPTTMVWLIGRTQTNGRDDYEAVHAIQDAYRLTPLGAWGGDSTPPTDVPVAAGVDTKTPPAEQVARMDAEAFFARLNALMRDNPPARGDAAAMARFAGIGVAPGRPFVLKDLAPPIAKGVVRSAPTVQARLAAAARRPHGTNVNGWQVLPANTGSYGEDYLWRAIVARIGLGANLPADAVYPHATVDARGAPLTGARRYRIRFPKGQLPPVRGFWSVTVYDERQALVRNPIGRYALGDRDRLKLDDDGALTLHVQHASPGRDEEANWLPTPAGPFNLFMRLYWPREEVLVGTWRPPAVEPVDGG